jgi:putative flippase GtrA
MPRTRTATPDVEIVGPVHNAEASIERSLLQLYAYLSCDFPYSWQVTVVDNASTDATFAIAGRLADRLPGVCAVHLGSKGRGGALRAAWSGSDALVLAYMDVDLSTDLAALPPLVAPLLSGHSDLSIGTRLTRSARVVRGPRRELISRCYNTLLHATLATRFSDAQCGFKAIRADRARELLPLVEDTGWFFDTELLVLAERAGLRIHEVPVDWVDDPDSRVDILRTASADLRGVARLARGLADGSIPVASLRERLGRTGSSRSPGEPGFTTQVLRFVAVGLASTVAYLALYVVLRPALTAGLANAVALLVTAVANTAANRRYTFDVREPGSAIRHQAKGLAAFGFALAVTSGSLALLHAVVPQASRLVELTVLVGANLVATALRFLLLRHWVFGRHRSGAAAPSSGGAPAQPTAFVRPTLAQSVPAISDRSAS